jgi:putative phosphoesterase
MGASAKVAIVSDTHGELDPRIEREIARCDYAVHGGDVGGWSVIEAMRPGCGRPVVVLGNNDVPRRWPERGRDALAALPSEAFLDLPGGRLAVVHGHQHSRVATRHRWLRRRYPEARIVVYGHSHRLCIDQEDTPWVLNPGAAGRSRTFGGPSCLILHAGRVAWRIEVKRFSARASGAYC